MLKDLSNTGQIWKYLLFIIHTYREYCRQKKKIVGYEYRRLIQDDKDNSLVYRLPVGSLLHLMMYCYSDLPTPVSAMYPGTPIAVPRGETTI